jgi:hypothetical protein
LNEGKKKSILKLSFFSMELPRLFGWKISKTELTNY